MYRYNYKLIAIWEQERQMEPDKERPGERHGERARTGAGEEERNFAEFRRKVQEAEVLSAAMERLLLSLCFTGKLSVIVQNGRVLKSGYEEGYFRKPARSAR